MMPGTSNGRSDCTSEEFRKKRKKVKLKYSSFPQQEALLPGCVICFMNIKRVFRIRHNYQKK